MRVAGTQISTTYAKDLFALNSGNIIAVRFHQERRIICHARFF
jgi:hypothetical protein